MKKIHFIIIAIAALSIGSCKKPLNEVPIDFYTPENSYNNVGQFQSALAGIYLAIRTDMYAPQDSYTNYDLLGLDIDLTNVESNTAATKQSYFKWTTMTADNGFALKWWGNFYKYIAQANTIIDRADLPAAQWGSAAQKNAIVGEAKFLRAFAYHFLANMWGDVPMPLHETKTATFNYTRTKQDSVYRQCQADLQFAAQNMTAIDQQQEGRAPKEAAYHLLTEIDICLKDYPGAIAAANAVINGGKCNIMTARFGVNKSFTFSGYRYQGPAQPWGDVYWDLFREGNMMWKQGSKEAIWNISMDPTAKGGGGLDVNTGGGFFVMDRYWGPIPWQAVDKGGKANWEMDTLVGRSIGYLVATQYADSTIWNYKGDWNNDIRNDSFNIQRTFYFTNSTSSYYGQPITKTNCDQTTLNLWNPRTAPHYKKFVRAVPYGLATSAGSNEKNDGGRTWKCWYIMREAETYLLKAEAEMNNGDLPGAAADINVIRNRAHATPVTAADVNLDLILDERARELYGEEFRINTLMRTGKLVEYLNKYNGYLKDNNLTAPGYVSKLPIPNRDIQANTGAPLGQNPGY